MTVKGTVRTIESAFKVHLYRYRERTSGELFTANDQPSKLPPAAAAVFGLDDSVRGFPQGGSAVSASQLRTAYNAQKLVSAGTDGTGQTVAIFAEGGFSTQDVADFASAENLPTTNVTVSVPNLGSGQWLGAPYGWKGGTNGPSHDSAEDEAELDIEAVHGLAPGAAIHVYEAATDLGYVSFIVGLASFIQGVANDGEHVASISYGACEGLINPLDRATLAAWFNRLATAQQVSVFAASGDTGRECYGWTDAQNYPVYYQGVNYPASDPSVTGVGGTHLDLTSSNTLYSEQAWDNPDEKNNRFKQAFLKWGIGEFASGGGTSSFSRPAWQSGLPAGAKNRMVPDVAADADPGLNVKAWVGLAGIGFNASGPDGGTSLAAPLWAGVGAIYDQYAVAHRAPLLGLANVVLYKLAGRSDQPLFDVTTAQDGGADLAGPVGAGWDAATGLGSPNVDALVRDGVALTAPTPANVNVRQVNWAGVSVPADACGTTGPVQLKDGKATATSDRFPGFSTVTISVPVPLSVGGGVSYGDLEKSGHDDAALLVTCDTGGGTGSSTLADSLVIYSGAGGLHPLGVLHTVIPSTYGATAFDRPSIHLAAGAVHAVESAYAAGDVAASPSLSGNDTWSWDGHTFHLTTPAPPASPTAMSCGTVSFSPTAIFGFAANVVAVGVSCETAQEVARASSNNATGAAYSAAGFQCSQGTPQQTGPGVAYTFVCTNKQAKVTFTDQPV